LSERCRSLGTGALAFPGGNCAGQARLILYVLAALDGARRASGRACLQHHLYDGTVLADAPIGNRTGRHADLGAIEGVADTLDKRGLLDEARVRNPIARLRAGMTLLNAAVHHALNIRFDAVGCSDGHLHVHDAVSCNRSVT
jgi:hypothetical protein